MRPVPSCRLSLLVAFGVVVSSGGALPALAVPGGAEDLTRPVPYTTFQAWCEARDTLPTASQRTVDVLLTELGAEDCSQAGQRASVITLLNLSNRQLTDIAPLASLPLLTELLLHNNAIEDISPLAQLPNLTRLYLSNNQISDLTPLSGAENFFESHDG